MEDFIKSKKGAIITSLISMVLWGSAIPMIKSLFEILSIPSSDTGGKMLIAGLRFFFAGVLTLAYMRLLNRRKVRKEDIDWRFLLIIALVQITLQYSFYYTGLSNIEGVKAAIIQATNAIMTVIISAILIKSDRLTKNKLIALLVGTLGIFIVNLNSRASLSFSLSAEGAILMSTFLNALASVLIRKFGQGQNPFVISVGQFLIGSIPLIVLGILNLQTDLIFTPKAIGLLTYGSFVSATAFTLWTILLQHHPSGEIGVYKLFIPIFGSFLSVVILGERFTVNLFIGLILVVLSSLILNRRIDIAESEN